MADSKVRTVALLELGRAIFRARIDAANKNAADANEDQAFIDTAKAVEEIFIQNGWFAPLPKPDFSDTSDDSWHPACNGTETPFIARSGAKLLYCFQPSTGNHAYIDLGKDMVLTDEEAQLALGTY